MVWHLRQGRLLWHLVACRGCRHFRATLSAPQSIWIWRFEIFETSCFSEISVTNLFKQQCCLNNNVLSEDRYEYSNRIGVWKSETSSEKVKFLILGWKSFRPVQDLCDPSLINLPFHCRVPHSLNWLGSGTFGDRNMEEKIIFLQTCRVCPLLSILPTWWKHQLS